MPSAPSRCQLAIAARDRALRAELAAICTSGGHTVLTTGATLAPSPQRSVDVAIVAGVLDGVGIWSDVPTVAVLPQADARAVTAALREGAAGVVDQAGLAATLTATIQAVACGQLCVPRGFAGQAERVTLSTREKQILGMVVLGFANIEIAQRLHVAESTVKSHLNSAFRKLGVRSRVEAANLILNPESGLGPGILTIPTAEEQGSVG